MSKIWRIRGRKEKYSDEELIEMIKNGQVIGNDHLTTNELKTWIKVSNSIYQIYLKEANDENI